jgi:FtsP/CotA-like multicopper oxidase with cupredoxin domain
MWRGRAGAAERPRPTKEPTMGTERRVTRRQFIRLSSLAALGGYAAYAGLPAAAEGMRRGGSTGTSIVDPPPGAALVDPPVLATTTPSAGVVAGSIEAREASVMVGGKTATLLTYNGSYPGPLIRVRQGDSLHLTFKNSLPSGTTNMLGHPRGETSLHTHGWHVSPKDPMDDVMHVFQPGDAPYTFKYDLSKQDAGTLCWYHPHIHELTAEQVWGGMHGLLLMDDDVSALAGYEQHVLVLKDLALSNGRPAPYTMMHDFMQGKEGDMVMVNGQVNPVLTLRPGQVVRLRLLNASNARFYKLQLQSHSLYVVGTDGGLLDRPYPQSYLLLSPGERADVLVKATTTKGSFKLSALPYARHGSMTSVQYTMLTLTTSGSTVSESLPAMTAGSVNPMAHRVTHVDTSMIPQRTFALSMHHGRGYINGQDFDVDPYTVDSPLMMGHPMYELWTITNQSGMDHPWHQHTNPAQVLSISGGDSAYRTLYTTAPAWKDVVVVPKWGSVRQLVRVSDWDGMAMFHCHILEHEDIGMMGIWNIGEMSMPM